jgi:hypothetical protein
MSEEIASAFDPENFQTVMLIQMMRTYDVLMAFLSVMDAEKAEILAGLHEQGLTFCPNPSLSIEDANNNIS